MGDSIKYIGALIAGLSGTYGNNVSYSYSNDTQGAGPTVMAVG